MKKLLLLLAVAANVCFASSTFQCSKVKSVDKASEKIANKNAKSVVIKYSQDQNGFAQSFNQALTAKNIAVTMNQVDGSKICEFTVNK